MVYRETSTSYYTPSAWKPLKYHSHGRQEQKITSAALCFEMQSVVSLSRRHLSRRDLLLARVLVQALVQAQWQWQWQ